MTLSEKRPEYNISLRIIYVPYYVTSKLSNA